MLSQTENDREIQIMRIFVHRKNGKQAKMKSGSMKYFVDVLQLSVHEVVTTEKMLNQITALIVDINEQIFL